MMSLATTPDCSAEERNHHREILHGDADRDDIDDYDDAPFDLEQILDQFETGSHRNIVLLELMALVYADGRLAQQESLLLDRFVDHCHMNPNLSISLQGMGQEHPVVVHTRGGIDSLVSVFFPSIPVYGRPVLAGGPPCLT